MRKRNDIDDETRRLLAKLAQSSKTRRDNWTRDRPADWQPSTVQAPEGEFHSHFTRQSAWEFIVSKLEGGHPVEIRPLRKPPGAVGYVLKIEIRRDQPDLYIKLELNKRRTFVFGRSFHYSRRA